MLHVCIERNKRILFPNCSKHSHWKVLKSVLMHHVLFRDTLQRHCFTRSKIKSSLPPFVCRRGYPFATSIPIKRTFRLPSPNKTNDKIVLTRPCRCSPFCWLIRRPWSKHRTAIVVGPGPPPARPPCGCPPSCLRESSPSAVRIWK